MIENPEKSTQNKNRKIAVTKNGPYIVSGGLPLDKEIIAAGSDGIPLKWEKGGAFPLKETYSLCRCGASKNMPYCDGAHKNPGFDGTETAGNVKYMDQIDTYEGPGLVLTDAEKLCAVALFCHRDGDAWDLTGRSADEKAKETAVQESCDCPSGRLVAWDKKTGRPIEPPFEPSISVTEDPVHQVSGPLWVKGGVLIESSDKSPYEIRNRVTLCRCGHSKNKPFCDGCHITSRFSDGDESIKK